MGGWRLEVGGWRLEVGGWRLEVGGWRLEVRGWRLEVGEPGDGEDGARRLRKAEGRAGVRRTELETESSCCLPSRARIRVPIPSDYFVTFTVTSS